MMSDAGELSDDDTSIGVFVVTPVRLYRDGLAGVLESKRGIQMVGSAPSWLEALPVVAVARADVILLDVPVGPARTAVRALAEASPRSRVVVVGIHEVASEVVQWAEAGIAGYVSVERTVDELVETICLITRGAQPCSAQVGGALLRRVARLTMDRATPPTLTRRETEVLGLVERGLANKEIAQQLGISVATVKNHLHNIYEKLEVRGRAAALSRLGRQFTFA